MSTPASSAGPPGIAPSDGERARGWPWAEALFPLTLGGLGVFALIQASTITVPGSTNVVGPNAFPYAIGAVLIATGVAVLVGLARGHRGEAEAGEDVDTHLGTDWIRVALLTGSLLALIVLIEPLAGRSRRRCCSAGRPGAWAPGRCGARRWSARWSRWSPRSCSRRRSGCSCPRDRWRG